MNKKILAAFLCICMAAVTGSFPVSAAKTKKTYKIAIDAGHQRKGNSRTEPIGPGAKTRKTKVAYGTQGVKTKVPESKLTLQIALKLEKELKKRGLSKRDDLTGTNWSKIPVALIEMGFMTNKTEDKQMQNKQMQKKMVDGIANGIDQYFK